MTNTIALAHDDPSDLVLEPLLLKADQTFAALGIDKSTGYRAIRAGKFPIPVVRIGRILRFPTHAVRSYVEGRAAADMGTGGDYAPPATAETLATSQQKVARPDTALDNSPATARRSVTGGGR